jgi:HEPN domain-containing protein
MKAKANQLFDKAIEKLIEANEELCRPEEDVVSFMVCKNAQFAIENFLIGFLLHNAVVPNSKSTINELYEQCRAIDCRSHHELNGRSCSETKKVSKCLQTADQLESFLRKNNTIC